MNPQPCEALSFGRTIGLIKTAAAAIRRMPAKKRAKVEMEERDPAPPAAGAAPPLLVTAIEDPDDYYIEATLLTLCIETGSGLNLKLVIFDSDCVFASELV